MNVYFGYYNKRNVVKVNSKFIIIFFILIVVNLFFYMFLR